jgi:hypothetical protein
MRTQSNRLFEVSGDAAEEPFEEAQQRGNAHFQSRAPRSGADFKAMAADRLIEAGATIERTDFDIQKFPVDLQVVGTNGRRFLVLARGTPGEQQRSGLRRSDTVEKTGFMAMQLARCQDLPLLLLTSDLPKRSSATGHYLASLSPDVWDVISYRADLRGFQRLRDHLQGAATVEPPAAPWRSPVGPADQSLFDQKLEMQSPEDAPAQGGPAHTQ